MIEKCPEELLHGGGPPRELLLAGGADEPLHLPSALHAHQMTIHTLEDPGWRLHGVEADRAFWAGKDLRLGCQLGQMFVQLFLSDLQLFHHLIFLKMF